MVCLSDGIRSLLSSCAATVQSTSGGGGDGGLETTGRGELLPIDRTRRGDATFAINDCVGDEYVGAVPSFGFLGYE